MDMSVSKFNSRFVSSDLPPSAIISYETWICNATTQMVH